MITVPPFAALWRAGVAGIFGAASGFAVFVLWWEQRESHQSPFVFFLALLIAAGMSFGFESFRAQVEGHREDRARLPEAVVTIALLAVFEVFILGLHASIALVHSTKLDEVSGLVLGPMLAGRPETLFNLVIMMLLWVSVAVVLTLGLSFAVFDRGCELPSTHSWRELGLYAKPTARSALIGILVGGVGGPLGVLGYTFCVRVLAELKMILFDAGTFATHLGGVEDNLRSFLPVFLVLPVSGLTWLFTSMTGLFGAPWGPVLALAVSVGFAALCGWLAATKDGRFAIPALVIAVAYAVPLFGDVRHLFKLAVAVAVVWAFPGGVLGAMLPWLSQPSRYPRIWGFVAFAASGVLFLFARLALPDVPLGALFLAGAAIIFLVVGMLFQRGGAIERYWPILAFSIAVNVFGLTRLIQGADFFNIQKEVYSLGHSPLLTLQPRPKQLGNFFTEADLARWGSPLFEFQKDPMATWRSLQPPAWGLRPLRSRAPASVEQARAAMTARGSEMKAVQKTMKDSAEALRPSREGADKPLDASIHLSLRDQKARLLTREAEARKLLADAQALAAEVQRHLEGELVRPISEESPSWPSPIPSDLTDEWMVTLRKEQRDFIASRQAFEANLREIGASIHGAHVRLVQHLDELAKIREQIHKQIEWASLFELAMTASFGFWATIGLLTAWAIRHASSPASSSPSAQASSSTSKP